MLVFAIIGKEGNQGRKRTKVVAEAEEMLSRDPGLAGDSVLVPSTRVVVIPAPGDLMSFSDPCRHVVHKQAKYSYT